MTPQKKHRLIFLFYSFLSISIAVVLLLFALKDNFMYFYAPADFLSLNSFYNKKIRLGGIVKKNSLRQDAHTLNTFFIVCDEQNEIKVHYKGLLPDLFREGQGVVAEGKLTSANIFEAQQVLAKHDENYMPPEVAKSLNKSHKEWASRSLDASNLKGR